MRRNLLVVALVTSALASACGPHSKLQLDLRSVSITVPRLVTPAVVIVPAAKTPLPAPLPLAPQVVSYLPSPPASAPPVKPVPGPTCPKASPLAQPAVPAGLMVDSPPAAGVFTQAATGAWSGSAGKGSLAGNVTTLVTRLPSSVSAVGQKVDEWLVTRSDPQHHSTQVEAYQLLHPASSPAATAAGIYLVGLAWDDPARGKLVFQPAGSGLEILPLPVAVAQNAVQYVGAATDPNTLTTLQLTRNVMGRKRVDACGQLIDTFTVAMTGVLTTPSVQRQVTWTQQLATGYDAADVEDDLAITSPTDGFTWVRDLRSTALPKAGS